ncbi:hypothetical protein CLU79DRAFT_805102 [Phycomyces nitens]|nr:hypothetical protein CLU79DRAFT_805102 [Phycomyces nitens]
MPKNPKDFNVDKICVPKIAVFICPLDITQTKTKDTVLIHNAKKMFNFGMEQGKQVENIFQDLADVFDTVLALPYLNRYNIIAVKVLSKLDILRLCCVIGATSHARLGTPMAEEMVVTIRDNHLLPGAVAMEMELDKRLQEVAAKTPGLNQHAIKKFVKELEIVQRTIYENTGMKSTAVLSRLHTAHY